MKLTKTMERPIENNNKTCLKIDLHWTHKTIELVADVKNKQQFFLKDINEYNRLKSFVFLLKAQNDYLHEDDVKNVHKDTDYAFDPKNQDVSDKDSVGFLTLECIFNIISVELFIKNNEAILRFPDDIYKIIEFYKIWDKQSKENEMSKHYSTDGTENIPTDRQGRTMVASNQNNNTQGFFSEYCNAEISSITIKISEYNDISENVQKLTEDIFGDKKYAYDSARTIEKHSRDNIEEMDPIYQKKIEEALGSEFNKDKQELYDPDYIKQEGQHYLSKNSLQADQSSNTNPRGKCKSRFFLCCW